MPGSTFLNMLKIYGHKKELEQLAQLKSLHHAMIFSGPRGIGKRRIAQNFALNILEENNLQHPDLHIITIEEGKRDIPAERIRELKNKLQLKSYSGKKKIAIIDDAEKMNLTACNAFLKTLEEPPGDSLIILVTDSPQLLLPTIISRCQVFNFSKLKKEDSIQILSSFNLEQGLIERLIQIEANSLALFNIETDPQTLEILNEKKLTKHLEKFIEKAEELSKHIDKSFRNNLTDSVVAASNLAESKENLELTFHIARNEIRKRIYNSSSKKECRFLSAKLVKLIETEMLIRQRSLNPGIQLSNAL